MDYPAFRAVVIALLIALAAFYLVFAVNGGTVAAEATYSDFDVNDKTKVVGVFADGGGAVDQYLEKYLRIKAEGKLVYIDGFCASACTFFLGIVPPERVCAGTQAIFGFHEVIDQLGFSKEWTDFYFSEYYPPWLMPLLRKNGFDGTTPVDVGTHPTGFIWFSRDDLHINHCPGT